jgi:hypothetical protein
MAANGKHLRRFRFCIEQPLREETAGLLIGAFREYLPQTKLEMLEIHATSHSPYFGKELIEALPRTLKRLYVSQELIDPKVLPQAVQDRYFRADNHEAAGNLGLVGFEYWECESTKLSLLRMNGALLDRERNRHLFGQQSRFGSGSLPVRTDKLRKLSVAEIGEDLMSTEEAPDRALVYYTDQTKRYVTQAEMVFHAEAAASAKERIPMLVMADSVEVGENDHWMTD